MDIYSNAGKKRKKYPPAKKRFMKIPEGVLDFYFITNRKLSRKPVLETVADAVRGGARIIQYREKDLPMPEIIQQAHAIAELCRASGVLFIVNDYVDVAVSVDADGLHIGRNDVPYLIARDAMGADKIVGVSVRSAWQAVEAERAGADYVGLGPIFPTETKRDAGRAIGVQAIAEARRRLRIPIVAIGGITLENCAEVVRAGADGVAAISDVVGREDIAERVAEFRRRVALAKAGRKSFL